MSVPLLTYARIHEHVPYFIVAALTVAVTELAREKEERA